MSFLHNLWIFIEVEETDCDDFGYQTSLIQSMFLMEDMKAVIIV